MSVLFCVLYTSVDYLFGVLLMLGCVWGFCLVVDCSVFGTFYCLLTWCFVFVDYGVGWGVCVFVVSWWVIAFD